MPSAITSALRLLALTVLSLQANLACAEEDKTYEYIVVGSGPGGGPVAANLARAGHSVLLLEAGDDQTQNLNVSIGSNFNKAGNDPLTRWDFFVKHFDDPEIESRYIRTTWRKPDGGFYVGLDPPKGSTRLGVYYPRAGTLGGCAMHNGALSFNPSDAGWDYIADLTGDDTWTAKNMFKYLKRLERVNYLPNGTAPHGYNGWLDLVMLPGGFDGGQDGRTLAEIMAEGTGFTAKDVDSLLLRDMNAPAPNRDQSTGIYGAIIHNTPQGMRSSPGYYVLNTVNEKKYPLTLQLDTLATKILFDKSGFQPKAIGVEYLQGKSLYSADPRYNAADKGKPGRAFASREVIISGGAFNSPQLLMLSGIGDARELKKLGIQVIADRPGVGKRLADNYEAGVLSLAARPLQGVGSIWAVFLKTSVAKIRDIFMWCGSLSFDGFYPGFPEEFGPSEYECAMVHMNPRSQAGSVTLRSTDPRDVPDVNLRSFKTGEKEDLQALVEGVNWIRSSINKVPDSLGLKPWKEHHPCPAPKTNCTDEEQKKFIKEQVYSHHATSSCAIGPVKAQYSVLDSKFRVLGVRGLRVVDASSFPKVPGAFPVIPTMMLGEKATDEILADVEK